MTEEAHKKIDYVRRTKSKSLNLAKCGLKAIPLEVCEMVWLEELILSNREWNYDNDYIELAKKGKDNVLYDLPKKLRQLKNLKTLKISGDFDKRWEIKNIDVLTNLTELVHLNISDNYISDADSLSKLTKLQTLEISDNPIINTSFFRNLTQLRSLNIRIILDSNLFFLSGLTKLQKLDISQSDIHDPFYIRSLTELRLLNLNHNYIQDLTFLSKLKNLKVLNISYNHVKDIVQINELSQLQTLNINHNRIDNISYISNLTELQTLNISDNYITELSSLKKANKLQKLDASNNRISSISSLIKNRKINYLDLRNNQISDLSPILSLIKKGIPVNPSNETTEQGIYLIGNPWQRPLPEIAKSRNESIIRWFNANKQNLNAIKLIFIGDPKIGKTSLLKKTLYNEFHIDEKQTDGINIEKANFGELNTFRNQKKIHEVKGYFWDFGGQEILSATHQIFLSKRSIYILVLDARNDKKIADQIKNWTEQIIINGENSPIVVVANKIDENHTFDFENTYELQREYPQIKAFIKTSCIEGNEDSIDNLKNLLEYWIPKTELFNSEIDEKWIPVREQLEYETKDFLSERQFNEICNDNNVHDKKELISFLHHLGIVLHFSEISEYLGNYHVLNSYWITYGIYRILTSIKAKEL